MLVHAAAGGVGSILVPWLKAIGAKVIAHSGSAEKAALAAELGADHALSCPFDELAGQVRALSGGVGCVLDGVGAASWQASLASLGRRGLMVSFGNASGPVPPLSPLELARGGSLFLTRPTLHDYVAEPGALQESAARLFEMIASGAVPVRIGARFAPRRCGRGAPSARGALDHRLDPPDPLISRSSGASPRSASAPRRRIARIRVSRGRIGSPWRDPKAAPLQYDEFGAQAAGATSGQK